MEKTLDTTLSLHMSQVAHQVGAYPGFSRIKQLEVLVLFTGFLIPVWTPGWG